MTSNENILNVLTLFCRPWNVDDYELAFPAKGPSAFLNHVTNFLLNFQFFFFSSTAAMYC